MFDPNVYLKRFFSEEEKGDYIFLVDEAHNLVERSREMYSAIIYKEDFLLAKKILKKYGQAKLVRELEKCNRVLLAYKRECEKYMIYESIGNLAFDFMNVASDLDEFLQKSSEFPERKDLSDEYLYYMMARIFRRKRRYYRKRYVCW